MSMQKILEQNDKKRQDTKANKSRKADESGTYDNEHTFH